MPRVIRLLGRPAGAPIKVSEKELLRLHYLRLAFIGDPSESYYLYFTEDRHEIERWLAAMRTATCQSCGAKNSVPESECRECNMPLPPAKEAHA